MFKVSQTCKRSGSSSRSAVAYLGEGQDRFAAANVSDVARLYQLAIERAEPGARYHAVAEEGVAMRDIAEALGLSLKLPVVSLSRDEAADYFGWMMMFAGPDIAASSALTQQRLGWKPVGPGLIADLERLEGQGRARGGVVVAAQPPVGTRTSRPLAPSAALTMPSRSMRSIMRAARL